MYVFSTCERLPPVLAKSTLGDQPEFKRYLTHRGAGRASAPIVDLTKQRSAARQTTRARPIEPLQNRLNAPKIREVDVASITQQNKIATYTYDISLYFQHPSLRGMHALCA
jgi:hypothetical protein